MRKEDILQSQPMTMFSFTTAAVVPRSVFFPVAAEFFVEECGPYRKLRFKCALDKPGVEVQFGSETRAVHTLDVKQSLKCINEMVESPVSPIAWWESSWRRAGPVPKIADRLLKILGVLCVATIEGEPGTIVATTQEEAQQAAESCLLGIDFAGWTKNDSPTVCDTCIYKESRNYPITIQIVAVKKDPK